ncbi:MAG: hypothetical protein WHV64_03210 [Geminicoccaceae bacterium]|jgi:hypothetical protein
MAGGEQVRRVPGRWCLCALLVGLAACGPVTGGRLLADERALRAIRTHYDAHARESEGCGEPFITRIRSGRVVGDAAFGAPTRVVVAYEWEAPPPSPGAPRCRGEGERIFSVLRTAEGPVVTAMSGPVR